MKAEIEILLKKVLPLLNNGATPYKASQLLSVRPHKIYYALKKHRNDSKNG
jgi:hypothetical protein